MLRWVSQSEGVDAVRQMLEADGNPVTRCEFFQRNVTLLDGASIFVPNSIVAVTQNQGTVILLDGVLTHRAAQVVWDQYTDPAEETLFFTSPGGYGFRRAATEILTYPQRYGTSFVRPHIVGYSAGGGVAYWLARFMNPPGGPNPPSSLTTFGMPKPLKQGQFGAEFGNNGAHWILSDDPVPLVPPPISTYQRIMGGLSIFQGRRISGYCTPQGVLQITLNGSIIREPLPSQVGADPVSAIQRWIQLADEGVATSHSLDAYVGRLLAAGASLPIAEQPYAPDTSDGGTGGGMDYPDAAGSTPAVVVGPDLQTALQGAINVVAEEQLMSAQRQNAQPPTIPDDRAFHAVRRGRTWYVTFSGEIFASAPHRRGARSLAATGNLFIRKLQTRAGVDTNALVNQWADYLLGAVDPATGFRPTMEEGLV